MRCTKCLSREYLVPLSCGCKECCLECTVQFFAQQVREQVYAYDLLMTCPPFCSHPLPVEEVLEIVKGSTEDDRVSYQLCKNALAQMQETVYCPRKGCGYIGWIDISTRCSEPVACGNCSEQWTVPQLTTTWCNLCWDRGDSDFRPLAPSIPLLERVEISSNNEVVQPSYLHWRCYQSLLHQHCPQCGGFTFVPPYNSSGTYCVRCEQSFCSVCRRSATFHERDCSGSTCHWRVVWLLLVLLFLLKVNGAYALFAFTEIWSAVVTTLHYLLLALCAVFTILIPLLLLLINIAAARSGTNAASMGVVMTLLDCVFIVTVIVTGWWSTWQGVLSAIVFVCCQGFAISTTNFVLFRFPI